MKIKQGNRSLTTDRLLSIPIHVIRLKHHQSSRIHNRHPSIIKSKFNNVIHVNIHSSRSTYFTNNTTIAHHNRLYSIPNRSTNHQHKNSSITDNSIQSLKSTTRSVSVPDNHQSLPKDMTFNDHSRMQIKDTWANPMDYVNKRKKKKKCTKKRIILCLLAALILVIVITVLLIVLLTKSTKTSITQAVNPVLRWNKTGITVAGISSMVGNTSNQLYNPWGLALNYEYALYIADRFNHRVQKFSRGSSVGQTVAGQANTTSGTDLSSLNAPSTIILDSNDNLYIADAYNQRIQFWANGASSGTLIAGTTGVVGNTTYQLNFPYGIARDSNLNILYVSDRTNHRVISFVSGNTSGTIVAGGNGSGINSTQLSAPGAIYFDSSTNSLLIANVGANNIVRWVLGENSWTLVAGNINGSIGNTSTSFRIPYSIALDPMGNMYVADRGNRRIQLFLSGQSDGITIAGSTGINGSDSTLLNDPYSVALDNQLNLYVADTLNQRVQKFLRY